MSNRPNGAFTWAQILEAAGKANVAYGAWMPQQWIDHLNEALREMPSQPEPMLLGEHPLQKAHDAISKAESSERGLVPQRPGCRVQRAGLGLVAADAAPGRCDGVRRRGRRVLHLAAPETKVGEGMNHTPGPWAVERDTDNRRAQTIIRGSHGDGVAKLIRQGHHDDANARLIAAAPEMFEALCGAWMALCSAPDWMQREDEYGAEIRAVRAAIDKALPSSEVSHE